jgi:hypothetical protein
MKCANGHDVDAGDRFCSTCAVEVSPLLTRPARRGHPGAGRRRLGRRWKVAALVALVLGAGVVKEVMDERANARERKSAETSPATSTCENDMRAILERLRDLDQAGRLAEGLVAIDDSDDYDGLKIRRAYAVWRRQGYFDPPTGYPTPVIGLCLPGTYTQPGELG